jgi:hypothetical protein
VELLLENVTLPADWEKMFISPSVPPAKLREKIITEEVVIAELVTVTTPPPPKRPEVPNTIDGAESAMLFHWLLM